MKKSPLRILPGSRLLAGNVLAEDANAPSEILDTNPILRGGMDWMSWPAAWFPRGQVFAGASLLVILFAFALDNAVDASILLPAHSPSWRIARLFSRYGDWPPILLTGLVTVSVLAGCRKLAVARLWLLILVAGLLTGLGSTLIRATIGRTRPNAAAPQGFYGPRYQGRWIAAKYEFASFPSGHTAVWAGLAGAAWFRRRALGIAFLAAAGAVAWSRLALGCHHFSDVTASLVWGLAVGPWACDRLESAVIPLWARTRLIFQSNLRWGKAAA